MHDSEPMKVGHTRHDLRELEVMDEQGESCREIKMGSPVASDSPLDVILHNPSRFRLASTQLECGNDVGSRTQKPPTAAICSDGTSISNR